MIVFTNCCAHIHSISYSFKLQFYIDPEDRWHPDYRISQTPSASTSTETLSDAEPRLPATDAHTQADEPTTSSSSSVATSPELTDRPSTPAPTEHADSRPTTPRQQLGDGFSVVPGPSRRLQRERPFSVAPDPMWNSSREIQPGERLATQAPPPYVLPPTYAEVVPPEPFPVETIEIDPSTLQSPTLDVRDISVSSRNIPHVPVTDEEAHNNPSYSYGPSWTFQSTTQAQNPAASEDEEAVEVDSESGNLYIGSSQATTSTDDGHGDPSHSLNPLTLPSTEEAENPTTSENETGPGDGDPNVPSQLSEKARGKKRALDEDNSSDERDNSETLEGEGGSGSGTSSDGDGQPDRKRMKMDTDTTISTDPFEVDSRFLIVARHGLFERLTDKESHRQVKKLKEIEKLYRRSSRPSLA